MVDRVELRLLDQPQDVWELHRQRALRCQEGREAGHEVVQIGNVSQDVVADQEVRLEPFSIAAALRSRAPRRWSRSGFRVRWRLLRRSAPARFPARGYPVRRSSAGDTRRSRRSRPPCRRSRVGARRSSARCRLGRDRATNPRRTRSTRSPRRSRRAGQRGRSASASTRHRRTGGVGRRDPGARGRSGSERRSRAAVSRDPRRSSEGDYRTSGRGSRVRSPRRSTALPKLLETALVPERIHALPEAVVTEHPEFTVARQTLESHALPHPVSSRR